jgi:hypothetical protein
VGSNPSEKQLGTKTAATTNVENPYGLCMIPDHGRPAMVVIVYSSAITENRPELPSYDPRVADVKRVVGQANIGNDHCSQEARFGNPLVVGSSPARPTSEVCYPHRAGWIDNGIPQCVSTSVRRLIDARHASSAPTASVMVPTSRHGSVDRLLQA